MQWASVWKGRTYDFYAHRGGGSEGVSIRPMAIRLLTSNTEMYYCLFCGLVYYGMLPDISNLV